MNDDPQAVPTLGSQAVSGPIRFAATSGIMAGLRRFHVR